MCGIVYVKRKDGKPARKSVLKRYNAQAQRGRQGFGYVAIHNNEIVNFVHTTTEEEIRKMLLEETAEEILFHHRFPTSTPNISEAAHPIVVENTTLLKKQYLVAHNGVIRNDDELKEKHEDMGFVYGTELVEAWVSKRTKRYYVTDEAKFNDSEALAIEIALAMEGIKQTIATEGSAAVIGLQTDGKNIVNRFFFRNGGNPLKFYEDNIMVQITSEGKGTEVKSDLVYKLRQEGGFEAFREGLTPPEQYRPTNFSYPGAATGVATPYTPQLPGSRESSVGFYRDRSFRQDDFEPDIDFSPGDDGYVAPARPLKDIIEEIDKMSLYLPFEKMMTTDAIWAEWSKCDEMDTQIMGEMEVLDAIIAQGTVDSVDAILDRQELNEKYNKLKKYLDRLDKELMKRETITENTREVIAEEVIAERLSK